MPPTVPVPLAALLDHPGLGLRQVAGPRGEAPVYLVHTSEMEDPVPFLLGGELLLSAGVHGPEATDAYWDRFAEWSTPSLSGSRAVRCGDRSQRSPGSS